MNRKKLFALAIVLVLTLLTTNAAFARGFSSQTTVQYITISEVTNVPCAANGAGEDVAYGGLLRVTMRTTVFGPITLVEEAYDVISVRGIGLTTGTRYIGTGTTRSTYLTRTGGNSVSTLWDVFNMIGEGPAPDLRVRALLVTRFNANGEVIHYKERVSVTCQ